jgi:DNA-binding MarR family transcriptional regulator
MMGCMSDEIDTAWLDSLTGYQLRRASHAMATDYAWFAGPDRLRPAQTTALGVIADNPGIHASTIGSLLRIARANMVQMVNVLVERDLVERRVSPTDRRVIELHLTETGVAAAAAAKAFMTEHEDRMLSILTDKQRRQLHDLLVKIADHDTVADAPRGRASSGAAFRD